MTGMTIGFSPFDSAVRLSFMALTPFNPGMTHVKFIGMCQSMDTNFDQLYIDHTILQLSRYRLVINGRP